MPQREILTGNATGRPEKSQKDDDLIGPLDGLSEFDLLESGKPGDPMGRPPLPDFMNNSPCPAC
ncbi:MAG: hypothetical protein DMF54_03380 [Acidobacteria bacterium]|nr:MAG: hypothetical protein DMF55_10095 [Acidobacteriota bacterium]PYQ67718.1 MAG: hypothetical protein DMF54_03380 [Acidobacteriota bacterium]